jgi:hypothetical protein
MANLSSFDYFFYHGSQPLEEEIASEVLALLNQPRRTLFYSRAYNSSGVHDYENTPNSLILEVGLPYDVVESIARRNTLVSDGAQTGRDRRVLVSQETVSIQRSGGNVDLSVEYIQNVDNRANQIQVPIGRVR